MPVERMAQAVWASKAADSDHMAARVGGMMSPNLNLASGKRASLRAKTEREQGRERQLSPQLRGQC